MANFQVPSGARSLGSLTTALLGTGNLPTQVTDVSPQFWFSPLQPVTPTAPSDYKPRQWAYQPGANLTWQPKSDESGYDYLLLRALAESWDLLRIALEMKKDEIGDVEFELRLKRQDNEKQADYKDRALKGGKELQALKQFWAKPDGFNTWRQWLRMLSEDLLVVDAVASYLPRDTKGRVAMVMLTDGTTWNRLLTDQGITPRDPNSAAYQQVVYGFPAWNGTTEDVVFGMQNPRTFRRYGFSRVERILSTIAFGIRRQQFVLAEYTQGNIPEAFLFMPSNIPPQRLKEFQDYIDSILSGNLENRRKIRMMPGFGDSGKPNIVFSKEALLKDELDVWLAQLVCATVGVSAQPFLKMQNRASAEEANDAAREKMLKPDVDFVCEYVNTCLEKMGMSDYEMAAKAQRDSDPLKQAQADKMVWGIVQTANEIREQRGEDPIEGKNANRLGVFSPQLGFMPLDPDDEDMAQIQQMKGPAPQPGGPSGSTPPKPKPGGKTQKLLSANSLEKYKYGVVMVSIDPNSEAGQHMKAMRDGIADADLMAGNDDGKTREEDPHITVRYGIKGSTEGLPEYLTSLKPFTLTFGRSMAFAPSEQSEGAAPLVVQIDSPELHAINTELASKADFTDPSFDYHPHATLAYVTPESADTYAGDSYLEGIEYPVRSIQYAMPDGETHEIMLTGGFADPSKSRKAAVIPVADSATNQAENIDAGFAASPGTSQLSTVEVARADHSDMQATVHKFFRKQADAAMDRVKRLKDLHKWKKNKVRKDDDGTPSHELIFDAAIGAMDWPALVNLVQPQLQAAGTVGVIEGLHQASVAGVGDVAAHIGKSQDLAATYAKERAAEMVGMKWVGDELVENPNARWAISDTTRDNLRELISEALSEETNIDDLAKRIEESGSFSEARAETIAKTEIARAQTEGVTGSWKQTGAVEKVRWSPSSLGPCPECADNVLAGSIPFGTPFPTGDIAPPQHPNCRCALIITKVRNREEKTQ